MKIETIEIGNFRKLKSVRIEISDETTVFVGANNSGKTSAMLALRYFLVERERSRFTLNDITLSHWPAIDEMGENWEKAKVNDEDLPVPDWESMLPVLDVWLHAEKREAHLVQKLIPTLDWDGGRLGVRLRLEPKDTTDLQKQYLAARNEARHVEEADTDNGTDQSKRVVLWPRSLTDFLRRRFNVLLTVKSYILDPVRLADPENGQARPQDLMDNATAIDGEPFKGLIRINEISAQRGFGQPDASLDFEDDGPLMGSSVTRRMSEQLRSYWNKHLDPFENPDPTDIEALRAIEQAQQAFDVRLREGFSAAIQEVEGMGYPGVSDPRLKISSRLKPVDGLNHEAAVQYVIPVDDGKDGIELSLPEDSNGLGYQNLISMIFRLMRFRDAWMRVGKAATQSDRTSDALIPPLHLVLIEEPEAYLHTQVQQVFIRQAYKVLRKHEDLGSSDALKTQLIVSTHSNHIAHECEFDYLRYFRRLPADEKTVPESCVINLGTVFGEEVETKRFVTRYIKVTHCDLFFADAAVFVEGPTERILVPFFIRHHPELSSLHECYITWIETGGSHAHRFRLLIEQLGLTTLIITDLDAMDADRKKSVPKRDLGLKSRNMTLRSWCPEEENLDALLDMKPEDKMKLYDDQRFSVRTAYQCPINIEFKGNGDEALCNTLEDALVMQNHKLFFENRGTGLWGKFKSAIEDSGDLIELSEKILKALENGGKAEFALNLLELEDPKALQPPFYILDGLKWLTQQLKDRQSDLGLSTNSSMDVTEEKATL